MTKRKTEADPQPLPKAPKLDYGYMETEVFKRRFSDPVAREQMKKNWQLMHPALDKSLGIMLGAFEQNLQDLFSQPKVTVVSLACGEADELPAFWRFFAQRQVTLQFIGIEQHQDLIESTRHKFRYFTNQQFVMADAADPDALGSHPLTATADLREDKSAKQNSNPEGHKSGRLKDLFGKTDLIIVRHPNFTSSLGHLFRRMITTMAPAFLRPGGYLLVTMYFEREKAILDSICDDTKGSFIRIMERVQDDVPKRIYEGELQQLDHYQCLLQKKPESRE